jgi:PEP-CTERM motif
VGGPKDPKQLIKAPTLEETMGRKNTVAVASLVTLGAFLFVSLGGLAGATTPAEAVSCTPPPPPALTLATVGAGISSFSYTCGGLTFSNFEAIDAGGSTALPINLVAAAVTGNRVDLSLNPNLGGPSVKDIDLYFMVSGGLSGIDLAVGGLNSTIVERACVSPIDKTSANNCTGGLANQLAALANFSGALPVSQTFGPVQTAFIFKDINKGLDGGLTSIDESFLSSVPEPGSLLLFGTSLASIGGLFRRWRLRHAGSALA